MSQMYLEGIKMRLRFESDFNAFDSRKRSPLHFLWQNECYYRRERRLTTYTIHAKDFVDNVQEF